MESGENNYLFRIAKERYEWEHQRKNEINNQISIPLGILSANIGFLVLQYDKLPSFCFRITNILFWISYGLSLICIILSIILFIKHQSFLDYAYISTPEQLESFKQKYILSYKNAGIKVDYDKIESEIKKTIYEQYTTAVNINIDSNEKKLERYRALIITVAFSLIFSGASYFVNKVDNKDKSDIIEVEMIKPIDIELNKSDDSIQVEYTTPILINQNPLSEKDLNINIDVKQN